MGAAVLVLCSVRRRISSGTCGARKSGVAASSRSGGSSTSTSSPSPSRYSRTPTHAGTCASPSGHTVTHARTRMCGDTTTGAAAAALSCATVATRTVACAAARRMEGLRWNFRRHTTRRRLCSQDHGLFSMYSSYLVQCSYATDSLDRNLLYFWHGLFCNRVQRMVWRLEASRAAYCAPRRVASDVAYRSLPAASRHVAMLHAVCCLRSHSAPRGTAGCLRVATF